ncbi:hypothetical protein K1719_036257 [Acacia pycnantha]|nr:hypothetical protein K1719_036257 [Acacia pycnantha]
MYELRRMRSRADSDSEISKGFCWCLIWMLDDVEPKEVLTVAAEDLVEMSMGLHVKAQSRVRCRLLTITPVALMSSCNPPFLLAIRNCSYWNGSRVDVVLSVRVS